MELDLRTLQTFHRMAGEGAKTAASRLTDIIDVETNVSVTKIQFVNRTDLERQFEDGREYVGVSVDLQGGPGGQSTVVLDRDAATNLTDTVLEVMGDRHSLDTTDKPASGNSLAFEGEFNRSTLTEISNMMNCGFIDGWANVLNTMIDISPPEFTEGHTSQEIFGDVQSFEDATNDLALVFQSRIEIVGTNFSFDHYLFPVVSQVENTLRADREIVDGFDYEKLIGFDQMVEEGAEEAASSMSMLTGVDTDVDVRNLNFIPVQSIPKQLSEQNVIGVAFTYDGLPSGYLLFVFKEESAAAIVEELLPTAPDDPFNELGQSALMELGNIMASGVLDGWANVLGTMIDHSPPEYIHDIGTAIMDPIVAQVGRQQEYAFVFDTTIQSDEKEFDCSIYSICDEGDLENALSQLDMGKLNGSGDTPSFRVDDDTIDEVEGELDEDDDDDYDFSMPHE